MIIFYKDKPPSQKVLVRVDSLLSRYSHKYSVKYYNIENENSQNMILKLGLPSTHFPFAIVINGSFTANIGGKTISFLHFPKFMHGIGRHEGNWSLEALILLLDDHKLLKKKTSFLN